MKPVAALFTLAAKGLADTAQFVNTSFTGPFNVGQNIHLMWTTGNSMPVSLSIANSTWNTSIFTGRSIIAPMYDWTVSTPAGMMAGNYHLVLEQMSGGVSNSPDFQVVVPASTTTSTTTVAGATTTVTLVYWDHECGCKKSTTAMGPLNTGSPGTTTIWWDNGCSCHKTAMVPVATLSATNNYTVPANPPAVASVTPTTQPMPTSNSGGAAPSKYTGGAMRLGRSMVGAIAVIAAAVLA